MQPHVGGGGGEGLTILCFVTGGGGKMRGGEGTTFSRRRVSLVVEHSSANPKVPGSIPGPVSYRGHGL